MIKLQKNGFVKADFRKRLRFKKWMILFFLVGISIGHAAGATYSQTVSLSIELNNKTVKDVLDEIEKNSEYIFFYYDNAVDLTRKVSINVKDQTVNKILDKLFESTDNTYVIDDRQIFISRKSVPVVKEEIVQQQTKTITGTIIDADGEPLIGVNITVKGRNTGGVTDSDGKFSVQVAQHDPVLVVTYIGYKSQEIKVGNQQKLNIVLQAEDLGLDEVVVVGYGTQKKVNLTGSVSAVQSKDLTVAPIASTTNVLAGRLPGLISVQSNGQPGHDAADLTIRGFGNALVIVDGIEASFNTIDANQIESISILKDGAASIYGSRAGNGVILVTTKRGIAGKPTITFNATGTLQGITIMPDMVSAGQYAEMLSESWLQSGQPASQVPYTPEQIQKYYEGTDPSYPNTNWRKELIRDWAPQQQYNISVRGGNETIKYYGFFGYLDQESMWKKNGGEYKRYNFQSNIDAKILDNLNMQLTLSSIVENGQFPARDQKPGALALWQDYWYMLPIYPAHLPDPSKLPFGGNGGTGGVHITSNSELSGYNNYDNQNLNGTFVLNYDFKFIKGLSAKAFGNYVQYYNSTKNFIKPYDYYKYDPVGDIYIPEGSYNKQAQLTMEDRKGRTLTGQFALSYDRTFDKKHQITALALYEVIDYKDDYLQAHRSKYLTTAIEQLYAGSSNEMSNNGNASEMGRSSFVSRLNYGYMGKYLLEGIFRADASAKFSPERKWGYFPGVSVGWRISEETFMENMSFLDNLKIRGGYGRTGNDAVVNFQYLSGYHMKDPTYLFGNEPVQTLTTTGLANPLLTWEEITLYNGGLDFFLWKRNLYGEADIFYRTREGIPWKRNESLPSTFGSALPDENINSLNDRGFEIMLGTTNRLGDFSYDISANISWSRAKWDHYEEPEYNDPDEDRLNRKSGRWTDWHTGYIADKLFTSQEEIDALLFDQDRQGNKTLRPGDVRFTDLNGDGILDWRDKTEIGQGETPHWMTGLNMNLAYKGFDLSALFQGAFGYYKQLVFSNSMTVTYFEERWTEKNNNPHALVPRLGGSSMSWEESGYFYRSAGYLRLKTAALGYSLPKQRIQSYKIQQFRIYLAGTNLLTFDKLKKYKLDPEAPSGVGSNFYPQQRTITLGITLSF